jgi:hypothetical protein
VIVSYAGTRKIQTPTPLIRAQSIEVKARLITGREGLE